ncbi:MAG TPA: ABC transporter ATP-binding protein [Longimicrobium sp.]|nr:ABC transporter ATP-binding protein [Longimicrobium sp.]
MSSAAPPPEDRSDRVGDGGDEKAAYVSAEAPAADFAPPPSAAYASAASPSADADAVPAGSGFRAAAASVEVSAETRAEAPAATWAMGDAALSARGVRKLYTGGDGRTLTVLDGVDLDVGRGEAVSVIGRSGSGKSTLLQVLGGLDLPNAGEVLVGGRRLASLNEEEGARVRSRTIGFVFQFHHLLREFTALENVMMPQLIAGAGDKAARERARELLAHVGLEARLTHKPSQLSGGEQQRVAVARALANRPLVLLADEPSGNLDPETAEALHELFFQVCREEGAALVLVTHDLALAARAGRVLRLHAGRLLPAHDDADTGLLE